MNTQTTPVTPVTSNSVTAVTNTNDDDTPIVWSTPSCVQCGATKRDLNRRGIEYTEMNLEEHPEKRAEFKKRGFMQAPVVEYGHNIWAGYNPGKIEAIAVARATWIGNEQQEAA